MKIKKRLFKFIVAICVVLGIACVWEGVGSVSVYAASKASYKIINKRAVKQYKNVSATYQYQLPQLAGNSAVVKKINKSLRKDYKKSLKDKGELFDFFENNKYLLGGRQYAVKYYAQTTCEVTYNRNGYISFKYSSKWYEGGAYNTWDYGATYRLRDGKKMGIQDVLSGNRNEAKQKIASTYAKKISYNGYEPIMKMKYSEFNFYVKPNKKVVICFGPYQPMGGNRKVSITMKGKLK